MSRPGGGRVAAALFASRLRGEWRATPFYAAALSGPRPAGLAAAPRDFRPPDPELGAAALEGRFAFAGAELAAGLGGDPWGQPSPSRLVALQLHRFAWLPALLALGDAGVAEALRLWLGWDAVFGRTPDAFSWSGEALERRLFNLACGADALARAASETEAAALTLSLARQARHLLRLDAGPAHRAERLVAVAVAGAALAGKAGELLQRRALARLAPALEEAVPPDGVVKTRSPEQGLELLFDLATLDDALVQRAAPAPDALPRAADRLGGAVGFFRLGDGRLAALNGGGPGVAERLLTVDALTETSGASAYERTPQSGYHRLEGRRLRAVVDAGVAPPEGWSLTACAQPLGFALSAGRDRLFGPAGWTPDAAAPAGLRLTPAGCTLSLEGGSVGAPLVGAAAKALGARLVEGPLRVEARRNEADGGVWLDLAHDGWVARAGLLHQRRLFLDPATDELRGEDRLTPASDVRPARVARPFAVHFHLAAGVDASIARDGRSCLLRTPHEGGWRLRSDAPEMAVEPSLVVQDGVARRGLQLVLRGATSEAGEARVRWKLSAFVPPVKPPRPAEAAAEPLLDAPPAGGRAP